jgi:hypothetical protein
LSTREKLLKDAESFEVVVNSLPSAQISQSSPKARRLIRWSPMLDLYNATPDSDEMRQQYKIVRQIFRNPWTSCRALQFLLQMPNHSR